MDDFERELKEGFLQEAEQLLLDAEQCFLSLESLANDPANGDSSILEKIFRLAHSLKGSARAVGFDDIGHFTHELESLLVKLKNGTIRVDSNVVTLLLQSNDHLVSMVRTLKGDMSAQIESSELLSQIRVYLSADFVQAAPAPAAPKPAESTAASASTETQEAHPAAESDHHAENVVFAFNHPAAAKTEAKKAAPAQKPQPSSSEEGIRVSIKRLEVLMNNIGELVILQTVLNQHKHLIESTLLQKTVSQLAKITKDIQGISMGLRMIPLKQTFQKLHRTVRDTSKSLNKEVIFETYGDETEMDKIVIDHLGDPLVHLVRNAVDHGVESREVRALAGKPEAGRVTIKASHQGDRVVIEVKDDGKGLDANVLRTKAVEKGILRPDQTITDKQAYELVFHPGFSTKTEVTDISGRGVGMDVVKTNIESLQGEVQIETEVGKGTTFKVLLPLTLAIIDAMVVRVGEERYVVPVGHIHESLSPAKKDVHYFTNVGEVLSLRGENLPLFQLSTVLNRKQAKPKQAWESIAMVIRTGDKPFAILVDDIIGQQQVVIKRLGDELANLRGFSGSSILGDGRAALILDLNELIGRGVGRQRLNSQLGAA